MLPRGNNLDQLVRRAQADVQRFDRTLAKSFRRLEPLLYQALASIYRVCLFLDRNPKARDKFLETHGHGNTINPYQPIVRGLMGACHDVTRSQISKYAGVIEEAIDRDVAETKLIGFLKSGGGVKGVYEARVQAEKSPQRMLSNIKIQEARLQSVLGEGTRFAATRQTKLYAAQAQPGLALAVVRIAPDGSFTLHAIMDRHPDTIARMLAKPAV